VADDLIPPPSPAGRPDPDARTPIRDEPPRQSPGDGGGQGGRGSGGLWSGEEEATRLRGAAALAAADPAAASSVARDEAAAVAGARRVSSPYKSRFGFVLGALIGVALAVVGTGVLLAMWSSDSSAPEGWSSWRPTADDRIAAAKQIAEHVGPRYRLGDGGQLVAVQSGPLEIANLPLSVAVRTSAQGGDIELIDGEGVIYTLNGLGPRGSIVRGTPSEERHLLLRREALELALYTFRYRDDVDIVVALLPPPPPPRGTTTTTAPANQQTQALFFRPGDLRGELETPLHSTIPPRTPRPETLPLGGPEAQKIEALTRSNLFLASFQQGQDARAFLVLDRPSG
jgi:hypothetical protein